MGGLNLSSKNIKNKKIFYDKCNSKAKILRKSIKYSFKLGLIKNNRNLKIFVLTI